ncbi:MAG: CGGC domain-containing protein, partial [Candidatus Eisenbacteria bacterium]|nr:CGGC domain-containing protein [Candidatus Eisenbacteria bacterium]
MADKIRIGIIICNRYRRCAGGKCFRALRERAGAFSAYRGMEVELVGYTTCDGCPGGNVEYAGEEMVANGAEVIHLATGLVVGYPPCPNIDTFRRFLEVRHGVKVVIGTHPIPEKYLKRHTALGTWKGERWGSLL